MASSGASRRRLLIAGGVLSILGGISQAVCSGLMIRDVVVSYLHYERLIYALFLPGLPEAWARHVLWYHILVPAMEGYVPGTWAVIGGLLGALGIVAIVGGVSATRGKKFGLSLAGAVCALPSVFLGIAAVILVALGKRGFGVKE
jgi:hypothetical protein